ncbi:hypothetical protein [Roseateles sp.]|uniref:hypothetical protein n=1 Tax=Roseateles sp. TaxID=1971397 RepID=UPI0031D25C59
MSALLQRGAAPAARAGFELIAWADGVPVRLSWGDAVGDATGAAVALRDDAAWISALEDWLAPGDGLDWRPFKAGEDEAWSDWIPATVAGQGRAPRLALPWRTLRGLPPPPEVLGLLWPSLEAELLLTRQRLPPEGLEGLVAGSVLLMEASFARPWPVTLRRLGDAHDDGGEGDDAGVLEVRMTLPDPLPVPVLAGWSGHPCRDTPPVLDGPLHLHLRSHPGSHPGSHPDPHPGPHRRGAADTWLAEGQALPWGLGHALRVTRAATVPELSPSPSTAAPRP